MWPVQTGNGRVSRNERACQGLFVIEVHHCLVRGSGGTSGEGILTGRRGEEEDRSWCEFDG